MQLRSETCHCSQATPLSQLLLEHQKKFQLENTTGSLVVTYSPSYTKQMCIESFHYHYINDERNTGGHVFDLVVETAHVSLQSIENFQLDLVNLAQLAHTDLSINSSNELKKIE